jgi:Lon protease-like protein
MFTERMNDKIQIPSQIGAMILPGAALFPGALLPLYIFEPRYRLMLAKALESDRIFAVSSHLEGGEEAGVIGGLGIVRACVANEDGTSNLVLQGIGRVKFCEWIEGRPYPLAAIETVPSKLSSPIASGALRKEILTLVDRLVSDGAPISDKLLQMLADLQDVEAFSDLAASCLVNEAPVRQRLLEEPDITHRLEILAAFLTHLLATK